MTTSQQERQCSRFEEEINKVGALLGGVRISIHWDDGLEAARVDLLWEAGGQGPTFEMVDAQILNAADAAGWVFDLHAGPLSACIIAGVDYPCGAYAWYRVA